MSIEATPTERVNSQKQPIIILLYTGLERSRDTNSSTLPETTQVSTRTELSLRKGIRCPIHLPWTLNRARLEPDLDSSQKPVPINARIS